MELCVTTSSQHSALRKRGLQQYYERIPCYNSILKLNEASLQTQFFFFFFK